MAKLRLCDPNPKRGGAGSLLLSPVRSDRRHRRPPAKVGHSRRIVQFPQEYNLVKLDNDPPAANPVRTGPTVLSHAAVLGVDTLHLKLAEGNLPDLPSRLAAGEADRQLYFGPYTFRLRRGAGAKYRHRADVFYQDRKIGTLLWGPTLQSLRGFAKFEVENRELYAVWSGQVQRSEIVDQLVSVLQAKVVGVYRIDVFVDSHGVIKLLERIHRREIRLVREKLYQSMVKSVRVANDAILGFTIGSAHHGRTLSGYNKSEELKSTRKRKKDHTLKSHIDLAHGVFGGELVKPIGRFESRLLLRFLASIGGFVWTQVFDPNEVAGLLQVALKGYFEWVPVDHPDSKINRRPRVQVIDFGSLTPTTYRRATRDRKNTDRADRIYLKKTLVDAAFVERLEDLTALFEVAEQRLDACQLYQWLSRTGATSVRSEVFDRSQPSPLRAVWQVRLNELLHKASTATKVRLGKAPARRDRVAEVFDLYTKCRHRIVSVTYRKSLRGLVRECIVNRGISDEDLKAAFSWTGSGPAFEDLQYVIRNIDRMIAAVKIADDPEAQRAAAIARYRQSNGSC